MALFSRGVKIKRGFVSFFPLQAASTSHSHVIFPLSKLHCQGKLSQWTTHCVQPHFGLSRQWQSGTSQKPEFSSLGTFIYFLSYKGFYFPLQTEHSCIDRSYAWVPALRNPHGFTDLLLFSLMQLWFSPSSFQTVPWHQDKIKSWLIVRGRSWLTLQAERNFWFPKGTFISKFQSHHTSKGPPERKQNSPPRTFNSPWICGSRRAQGAQSARERIWIFSCRNF